MHERQGSIESTDRNQAMTTTIESHRPSRSAGCGDPQGRSRTYEQPALADTPLNPKRSCYVLQLIL
jgi:hypothetical protein